MEMYFLRHGEAEIALFKTPEADFERNLTPEGQKDMFMEAVGLKKFVKRFDLILTSRMVRTYQTAVIFGQVFNCRHKIVETDVLDPPWRVSQLLEMLALRENLRRVLLVGSSPGLDMMTTEIVTGIEEEALFPYHNGSLMRLDMDYPDLSEDARLIYFLPPEVLKKLGEQPEEDTFEETEEEEEELGDDVAEFYREREEEIDEETEDVDDEFFNNLNFNLTAQLTLNKKQKATMKDENSQKDDKEGEARPGDDLKIDIEI